ncbi:MAG: gas vesicle protein [Deltaproteobacteria bacterium]|nr:gas vesicle protein [Deltaproteobacteria bacterium]
MGAETSLSRHEWLSGRQVSLVEVLDRVLNKGAVLTGGITISVADIPLLYVGLNLLIASVETLKKHLSPMAGHSQVGQGLFPHPYPLPEGEGEGEG